MQSRVLISFEAVFKTSFEGSLSGDDVGYESKVKHCTAASDFQRIPFQLPRKKIKRKVDVISYYSTRGMLIATCHGQFHSQKLWLKYNVFLIVHDSEHFMLTATLLQIATTLQKKKDSSKAKPHHSNCCLFPLSAMERGLSHWDTKQRDRNLRLPFCPSPTSLQITRKKGIEQT